NFLVKVSQNSMFGGKEIFVVKRFEQLKNPDKFIKSLGEFSLAEKDVIFLYEEEINEFGKRTNEPDKKSKEALEKIGEIILARTEDQKKSTENFVIKELGITKIEALKLLEIIGEEFFKVRNEVEKIKNFLGDETYSLEKVQGVLIASTEFNIRKLIDKFLISKEKKDLLVYLEQEKLYFQFVATILEEMITLYKLKLLLDNREIRYDISYNDFNVLYKTLGKRFLNSTTKRQIPAYPIFLKIKLATEFDSEFLLSKIKEMSDIEYEIKSGNISDDIAIYKFVCNF
ncbi:MAG: hypothetical protein ACRCSK_02330, partial [Fusobacteriaceae bacterium]